MAGDEMVEVVRPDGRRSKIPKSSVQAAIAKGYKPAPAVSANTPTVSAQPPFFSSKGLKSAGYGAVDSVANALPTAGGGIGGLIGGTGGSFVELGGGSLLGAVGGAGIGGMGGEAAKNYVKNLVFGEGPQSSGESATDITKEGTIQAVMELLGQGVGRGIGKMRNVFPSVRTVDGIPLTQSERTGSKAASMVEHFMERSMPSAGPMQAFREQQTKAIVQRATEVAESINGFKGTQEERGRFIQKAIEEGRKRMSEEVSSAYKAADHMSASQRARQPFTKDVTTSIVDEYGKPMMMSKTAYRPVLKGGAPVRPTAIRRAAGQILSEIYKQKSLLDPVELEPLVRYLKQIRNSTENIDFMATEKSRGTLLSMIRKYDGVLGNRKTAILRYLEDGIDHDLMRAAKDSGISGLEDQIKVARSLSREQHRIFDQQLMKNLVEGGKPEALAGYVRNAGNQEVRDLTAVLGPDKQKMVASQVMEDILSETLKKPAPVPKGLLAKLTPRSEAFQGDQFVKSIRDMGPEKAQLIFGSAYPKLRNFMALAERVKPGGSEWMALHNALYLGAVAGLPFGHFGTAAAVGADALSMRLMAKAMIRPEGLDAATKYLMAVARHSPRAAKLALDEFASVQRDERGDPLPWINRPLPQELRP